MCSAKRGCSRVSGPRGCGRSISTMPAIWPGRADMTTTRVERKTDSAIECVTKTTVESVSCQIRSSSLFIRSRVISSRAPNGSSISSSGGENESARAIETRCCMPPDSCQGWCFSKPVSSTRSSISPHARLAAPPVPAGHLERQRDVLRDRAPVVEDGVLEDDPVVAVEPGLVRGLAVDEHVALARPDQVADDPQQRRLAAAGGADQRDELARLDVEVDPVEREHVAALEALREAR